MGKILTMIMHHVIRFCYPYFKDIEEEKRLESETQLRSKFRHIGLFCHLGEKPFVHSPENITIGNRFYANRFLRLETILDYGGKKYNPIMNIGNDVFLSDYVHIGCAESVTICDGCLIASKVFITDHYHGNITINEIETRPNNRPLSCKPVFIGSNVWLGDNVSVMPGVSLGDNVIVGANSVVTKSFPANVVIAGCPAKIIKELK